MHVVDTPAASPPRLTALMRTLGPALEGLAYRVVGDRGSAEEVVQDSFAKLAGSPLLARPDGEVAAWIRRVTLNAAFNRARDERRARDRDGRAARLDPHARGIDEATPLAAVLAAEERAAVRRALALLPERQRAVLLLRSAGSSYAEIAATVEIAPGSVGVLLARAERAFRRVYPDPQAGDHRGGDHDHLP